MAFRTFYRKHIILIKLFLVKVLIVVQQLIFIVEIFFQIIKVFINSFGVLYNINIIFLQFTY